MKNDQSIHGMATSNINIGIVMYRLNIDPTNIKRKVKGGEWRTQSMQVHKVGQKL